MQGRVALRCLSSGHHVARHATWSRPERISHYRQKDIYQYIFLINKTVDHQINIRFL